VISFYRASLAPQLHWPGWVVLIILVLVVAALLWLLLQRRRGERSRAGGECCPAKFNEQ
jgi:asparagine N-glycosylation enzyme membrane subunit Stt3